MQSRPAKKDFIDLAKQPGVMGREDCQGGWHYLAARLFGGGGTVLDVGAGLGLSKTRIPNCETQDLQQNRDGSIDHVKDVFSKEWKLYDYVTCFDVIEHVVEDIDFLRRISGLAREFVFVTTPNWNVSKAANGCHCREYTPLEFSQLVKLCELNAVAWLHGNGIGDQYTVSPTLSEFLFHTSPHQAVLIEVPL